MMDINRNQYFLIGLVLLLLGIQFRLVDSYVLTPEFTQVLAERTGDPLAAVNAASSVLTPSGKPLAQKTLQPPEWLGWLLLSAGSVLVLYSLSLKKPDKA